MSSAVLSTGIWLVGLLSTLVPCMHASLSKHACDKVVHTTVLVLLQDTLEKMIKAFPNKQKLRGARNYCEVMQVDTPMSDPVTGAQQPPGALMFTLRFEKGAPGRPEGVEAFYHVAPLLCCGGTVVHTYQQQTVVVAAAGPAGQAGQQLQQSVKKLGHQLANLMARV